MKNILITLALCISLSACIPARVKPVPLEKQVVTQTEYVIKIPPAALMTLPTPVASINVDSAKQSDVAAWLLLKEQYTRSIENQLKDIASFFVTQQSTLDATAATQNIQQKQLADAAQAAEAADAAKKQVDLNAKPQK
jgi:hypothetical protein